MPRRIIVTVVLYLIAAGLIDAQPELQPTYAPQPCPVQFADKLDVECGTVIVPQDRRHPDERTVSLAFAIFKSQSEHPEADPILYLDGGPASRTLDSYANGLNSLLEQLNTQRDVIAFDYRGMGYSDPALTCPELIGSEDDRWITECRERFEALGVDVTDYTTRDNAADAADIVRALGYETYNIWGGSYGSSVAMTLLRDQPDGIRAAIVTALQPPQGDLQAFTPLGMLRTLDGIAEWCRGDAACSEISPMNLTEALAVVVQRLEDNPLPVSTGSIRGELNAIDVLFVLSELLKDETNFAMVPGFIMALYAEQYEFALPYANAAAPPQNPMHAMGAWLSMRCTDSILATTSEKMETALQSIDPAFHDSFMFGHEWQSAMCDAWGARIPGDEDRLPAVTNTPVLIISGALDPFSSQEWLDSTLETLPNGYGYMLPYYAHFVIHNPCAAHMLVSFIDDPISEPDASCLNEIAPPDFRIP